MGRGRGEVRKVWGSGRGGDPAQSARSRYPSPHTVSIGSRSGAASRSFVRRFETWVFTAASSPTNGSSHTAS